MKYDRNREHIAARYDAKGQQPLFLKLTKRPQDVDAFESGLKNMRLAEKGLQSHPFARVPKILAVDVARQAYLMSFLSGETLLNLCSAHDDHRPYLRQAGAWLSAYHRSTFQQERMFQPKFMARHMLHLVDELDRGTRRISGQKRFISLANKVQQWVEPCSGRISKIAAKHGDFNAHNILISDDSVGAYDFAPYSHAPVGYDIARILLSYMQRVGDIDALARGQVIPDTAYNAFFEGYDFVPPDDPGVTFLLRIQILSDWNRKERDLSLLGALRFKRLRKIANRALG